MKKKKCKEIKLVPMDDNMEFLLMQLEDLTDPNSNHFDKDILAEKEKIKKEILNGNITIDWSV
jgi:hypothetical protein